MDLNKVMLIGRLTRDPESRTTANGTIVCTFSVATGFSWKDQSGTRQEKTEFHNVVAWRRLAEICGTYLKKGKQLYVEGRLQTRSWDDPNGVKKYKTEVVADNIIMLGPAGGGKGGDTQPFQRPAAEPESIPTIDVSNEDEIKVENIPF